MPVLILKVPVLIPRAIGSIEGEGMADSEGEGVGEVESETVTGCPFRRV